MVGKALRRSKIAVANHPARWSVWSVAALAVGFWSQVLLWHGRLHRHEPTAIEMQAAIMQEPRPPVVRPQSESPRGPGISAEEVAVVVRELVRDLNPSRFPPGRVEVRAEVGADGRIGRMNISATPELEPRAQRRLQRAIKRTRFPASPVSYDVAFPIVFAH
jgi:hypothetical protein